MEYWYILGEHKSEHNGTRSLEIPWPRKWYTMVTSGTQRGECWQKLRQQIGITRFLLVKVSSVLMSFYAMALVILSYRAVRGLTLGIRSQGIILPLELQLIPSEVVSIAAEPQRVSQDLDHRLWNDFRCLPLLHCTPQQRKQRKHHLWLLGASFYYDVLIVSAIAFVKAVTSGGAKIAMKFRNLAKEQAHHINGEMVVRRLVATPRSTSRYIWVFVLNIASSRK
jgi:hypothetical protein